mgnify:CR=1 FL=1
MVLKYGGTEPGAEHEVSATASELTARLLRHTVSATGHR